LSAFQFHRLLPIVRRPFDQRDAAISERDAAVSERDRLIAERDAAAIERDRLRKTYVEVANAELPDTPFGRTLAPPTVDDHDLVARIVSAYQASNASADRPSESFWDVGYAEQKRDIHEALLSNAIATVQTMLRDPQTTDLCFGFENLARSLPTGAAGAGFSHKIYRDLLLLAEAVGARRMWDPEIPHLTPPLPRVDDLLALLDQAFGIDIVFPNPFPGEIGLATSRGVITDRAVQGLYQAWRILSFVKSDLGAHVVEIGAGLGRTAFYARLFGLRNYTIVDIPMTTVAQGYFLGRTLTPDGICLFGEKRPGIRILPPSAFLDGKDRYDFVLNADSLTEMDRPTARLYCEAIRDRAATFLSINHEYNPFTAREVCNDVGLRAASRTPYWMRAGYVEEVYRIV
jgi:hypothetical protein